jgi:Na+/alanine symporter
VGISYIFKNKIKSGRTLSIVVRVLCLAGLVYGAVGGLNQIWGLADLFMALLIVINLPVVLSKAKFVGQKTREFFTGNEYMTELQSRKEKRTKAGA